MNKRASDLTRPHSSYVQTAVVWMGLHVACSGHAPASSSVMPRSSSLDLQTITHRLGVVVPCASKMHCPALVTPAGAGGHGEEVLHDGAHTAPGTPVMVTFWSPPVHGPASGSP